MSAGNFIRGAAVGALFASVATLLLAPKAGKKTRENVMSLVNSLADRLGKELEGTSSLSREKYEEIVSKSVEEYAKGKKITKSFLNDLSAIFKKYFAEVKDEVSEIRETAKKIPAKKNQKSGKK